MANVGQLRRNLMAVDEFKNLGFAAEVAVGGQSKLKDKECLKN